MMRARVVVGWVTSVRPLPSNLSRIFGADRTPTEMLACFAMSWLMKLSSALESIGNKRDKELLGQRSVPDG